MFLYKMSRNYLVSSIVLGIINWLIVGIVNDDIGKSMAIGIGIGLNVDILLNAKENKN